MSDSEKIEALNDKHNESTGSTNSDQPKSTPDCKKNLSSTPVITEEMICEFKQRFHEQSWTTV